MNRTKAQHGSISNNYQCQQRQLPPRSAPERAPHAGQRPRDAAPSEHGEEGEKRPTWSRRRSNFFQYSNIDPTSAAILGDIEEIFSAAAINMWAGFPPIRPSLVPLHTAAAARRTRRPACLSLRDKWKRSLRGSVRNMKPLLQTYR